MEIKMNSVNEPIWKDVHVKSYLPDGLKKLEELAYNICWVWKSDIRHLFREIDIEAWQEAGFNPVQLLNNLSYDKLVETEKNSEFINKLDVLYNDFKNYMGRPFSPDKPSVAYFSMEYGLTEVLKLYSGGLGILAGDYLKEASDYGVDLTAIGLLYRYGYFTQSLSVNGEQIEIYDPQNFNLLPITQLKDKNNQPLLIEVPFPGRTVYANLWKIAIGRINLYLLDTDNELNSPEDKSITYQLYGGDWENRLKQEIMLGIGGILALKKLGIEKDVYHCNEGHAALINVQRLIDLINDKNLSFYEALEVVRSSSLYTVHTPVPAGHDRFDEEMFSKYMKMYAEKLKINWQDFMNLGREKPNDPNDKFSMSVFACYTCQEVNGVSWLHGKVSQEMFSPLWPGYFPEELHVGYVTNGVHLPTWTTSEWKSVYEKYFGQEFYDDQSNVKIWQGIYEIPDQVIWDSHLKMKKKLIEFIRTQFPEKWLKTQGDPSRIMTILNSLNPNALIIGFGRRFATYKRAHLLFMDLGRLEKIVNDPQRPVQFIFAGKAHPADQGGKDLIKRIVEISRMPQFLGKIIFLENYDISMAKRLISGVDIWLNTPTRPLEASGTSGQKAQMNGVLNFSVLDGWWIEGYVKDAGWAITEKRTYENEQYQDQLDAATIYSMLENEIIPLYFAKNAKGISPEWIQYIKNSIALITPRFTTKRMIDNYIERFYSKLSNRLATLKKDNYTKAKELAAWKLKIAQGWDNIEVVSMDIPEKLFQNPQVSDFYQMNIVIDVKSINDEGIGIELVVTKMDQNQKYKLYDVEEFKLVKADGSTLYYALDYRLNMSGTFKFGFRMFPKNIDLPHRQDLCYVRWLSYDEFLLKT
ncbi:MAG TPA: alpha-glucan family phosphorylase [Paludibacteraceae bacterium]|nr:alpha-glucan family phosphorylase [Paludibacteraceae bacterium]